MQVLAHGLSGDWSSASSGAFDLRRSYDRYYESGLYDSRYPSPNPHMLDLILAELGPSGGRVLDFGCGSGRYALPLSWRPGVEVFAYDLSAAAIHELHRRAEWMGHLGKPAAHLEMLCGGMADLERRLQGDDGFDLVLLLFGVLGHIRGREQRVQVLRSLRARLRPGGRLIATVPNRARRFLAEQRQMHGLVKSGVLQPGDIHYARGGDGNRIDLYYHLYTPSEFLAELAEAGLKPVRLDAESVLPERAVLGSRVGATIDGVLRRIGPLALAYGFVAVAEAATDAAT